MKDSDPGKLTSVAMLAGMRAVVDCILPSVHTTAEIDRVTDQALIFLISVFGLSKLHLLSENTVSKCFAESFYLQPFNAMFVFNIKGHSLPMSSLHCVWQVISNNNHFMALCPGLPG